MLTDDDRADLLARARAAAKAEVFGHGAPPPDDAPPKSNAALWAEGGVFVTLKTHGRLRGCLGCFRHEPPRYKTVAEYAVRAVRDDPRFAAHRLRPEEWPAVRVEVSVLSPLVPCADPMGIRLGVDGIYLESAGRSGCFLPQVAVETGWDAAEFWERCGVDKAGLPSGAWRAADGVRRWTFTADVFGDEMH